MYWSKLICNIEHGRMATNLILGRNPKKIQETKNKISSPKKTIIPIVYSIYVECVELESFNAFKHLFAVYLIVFFFLN